jgi:hypothetical protein
MNEDDVFELDKRWREGDFGAADEAIEALRAEAWYPIEKAERIHERELLGCQRNSRIWEKMYWSDDKEAFIDSVTGCRTDYSHFKRISPPEAK